MTRHLCSLSESDDESILKKHTPLRRKFPEIYWFLDIFSIVNCFLNVMIKNINLLLRDQETDSYFNYVKKNLLKSYIVFPMFLDIFKSLCVIAQRQPDVHNMRHKEPYTQRKEKLQD